MVCVYFLLLFQLDDWVLCRIYKKRHSNKGLLEEKTEELPTQHDAVEGNNGQQNMKFPRAFSITHLLDLDYLGPISQLFNDNSSINPTLGFQNNTAAYTNVGKIEQGEMPLDYSSASTDFQVNQSNNFFNQAIFINPANDWNGLSRWKKKEERRKKKKGLKIKPMIETRPKYTLEKKIVNIVCLKLEDDIFTWWNQEKW